jgi:hypothetical protein
MRGMFVFLLECIWHWIDDWEENGHFKFWWGFPRRQPNPRPHVRTPGAWVDLLLRWVRPDHHVALGCSCPERELARAPPWGHLALGLLVLVQVQTRAPGGAGFPCPGWEPSLRPHMVSPGVWTACPFAGSNPRATWCWGWLALFPGLRVRPGVALGPQIIIFFSINNFNDNKNNNLCTLNNNIFDINTLNYNKNKYYYFQL